MQAQVDRYYSWCCPIVLAIVLNFKESYPRVRIIITKNIQLIISHEHQILPIATDIINHFIQDSQKEKQISNLPKLFCATHCECQCKYKRSCTFAMEKEKHLRLFNVGEATEIAAQLLILT